jgi:flagellar hook-associated protein 3 FlgL
MGGPMTLRFTTQATVDVRRITRELAELQGKVASGAAADDLQGFGGGSSRLLNAKSMMSAANARSSVINQLQARFGVQGAALGQVASATEMLSQAIRAAVSANDGRGIATELELSFSSVVSALNETWNGQPLFAGERQGPGPVKINTLDELVAATGPDDIFAEAERHQTLDLGAGAPIRLSAKASELSQGLFDTLKQLQQLVDAAGGEIGQPISTTQLAQLQTLAEQLDQQTNHFTTEEGRAGQLQLRFDAERIRLNQRSNLLVKEIGEQVDADPAALSIQLSALLTQYEATAKTFAELSKLSLLNYL